MSYAITLPNGRACGIGAYARGWKRIKEQCADGTHWEQSTVTNWDHFPVSAIDVLRDLRAAMHDRINRHDTTNRAAFSARTDGRWWQWKRDQRALHDSINNRVRVYQFETPDVRARFSHLLSTHED
jgi:hypothetical protein